MRGFTLMELLLVLALVALLASLSAPMVNNSIVRARESALKEDLYIMRKAIDDYYADVGAYPNELSLLVEKRYLRRIPTDPFTDRTDSWVLVRDESEGSSNGIMDVLSGAEGEGQAGGPYREW